MLAEARGAYLKIEVLNYIAQNFFQLTAVPSRVYHGKHLLNGFSQFKDPVILTKYDEELLRKKEPVGFLLKRMSLAFGKITCKESDDCVILGPVKTLPVTNNLVRELLLDNDLPLSEADELRVQLDKLVSMNLEYYAEVLAAVYCSINHELVSLDMILDQIQMQNGGSGIDTQLLAEQESIVFGSNIPHNTYYYEQKLLHCVKNGLVEELHSMGVLEENMRAGAVTNDTVSHYKSLVHAQVTLISRAAIEGGLDPETAYSISDLYLQQIEGCHSLNELGKLSYAVRNDYCRRVREIKYPLTDDVSVNKAILYIIEHVHESLSAQQIAEHLGISRVYLSSKFKKATGVSIPDYINEQKIIVAKMLLRFSDKTLSMISNYLSYSSQSYFQTQFKRITGMTPTEYKRSAKV